VENSAGGGDGARGGAGGEMTAAALQTATRRHGQTKRWRRW